VGETMRGNMTYFPLASLELGFVLLLASVLSGCSSDPGYRHLRSETVTDLSTGVRKQLDYWQYGDGSVTHSTKVVFLPQGNRIPRLTKLRHP
jgi:hypothetical protein